MNRKITPEEINHIAKLAKLELPSNQLEQYSEELSEILENAELLNSVDTEDVEMLVRPMNFGAPVRDDFCDKQNADGYCQQAPEFEDDFFVMPAGQVNNENHQESENE